MKIFIFENLDQVSDNYHPGGGVVIIANDKDQVLELINQYNKAKDSSYDTIEISDFEWEKVKIYELKYELKNFEEEKIFVFPNAGCC